MFRFNMSMLLLCLTVAGAAQGTSGMQGYSRPSRDSYDLHIGTATVTGTVLDAVSQHPVRLAQVSLVAVSSATGSRSDFRGGSGSIGRTGVDGTFTIEHVAAGDYYVVAAAVGYVPTQSLIEAQMNAGAPATDALRSLTTVHVNENGSANATVLIQRGSGLGGTVQWGDGLPAAGAMANSEWTQAPNIATSEALRALGMPILNNHTAQVDDRGRFRLTGLPQGDYLVSVYFMTNATSGFTSQLTVYYPGVFHKSEAKPVSVRLGEDRDDLQMTLNLSELHSVSGAISPSTGTVSIRSGTVVLQDVNDKSYRTYGLIHPDGTFAVNYVPPGNYTVSVNASSADRTTTERHSSEPVVMFTAPSQTLTVSSTDVMGMTISVTPSKSN